MSAINSIARVYTVSSSTRDVRQETGTLPRLMLRDTCDHLSFAGDKELRAALYRCRSSISCEPAALSWLVNVIRQTSSVRPYRDRLTAPARTCSCVKTLRCERKISPVVVVNDIENYFREMLPFNIIILLPYHDERWININLNATLLT